MEILYWVSSFGMLTLVLLYRRKSNNYEELLLEASGRAEISRRQVQKTEEDNTAKQLKIVQLSKLCETKEQERLELEKKLEASFRDLNSKLNAIEHQLHETKIANEKLISDNESLQLKYAVLEKEHKSVIEKPVEDTSILNNLERQIETLKLENESQKLKIILLTKEMEEKSRKLTNAEHLYLSMKGLKEISEERAENWELALSKISDFVLKEKKVIFSDKNTNIGEAHLSLSKKVVKALEAIGANFDDAYPEQSSVKETTNAKGV